MKTYKFKKKTISANDLWMKDALSLLYWYYKRGEDYESNAILVDLNRNVVGISDFGAEWTTLIYCSIPKSFSWYFYNEKLIEGEEFSLWQIKNEAGEI